MKLHPHPKVLGGLVVSAALLLSACGASGGSDSADKTTTTAKDKPTTTVAKTTTTEDTSAAQDRADSVDITVSDFPDGWSAEAHDASSDDSPIKDCDPTFGDTSDTLAKHNTDDFVIGSLDTNDGSQFSAATKVFTDEETATKAIDPFNNADVITCIDGKLKEAFGDGTNGITITGKLSDDDIDESQLGVDQSEGISATYTISATDGSTAKADIGVLALRTGDVSTIITILSVGGNLDVSTLQGPIKAIGKAQAAA